MNRLEFFERVPPMVQAERKFIHWSYHLGKMWHRDQFRDDEQRYFEHVRGVSNILIDLGFHDWHSICLGMLLTKVKKCRSPKR